MKKKCYFDVQGFNQQIKNLTNAIPEFQAIVLEYNKQSFQQLNNNYFQHLFQDSENFLISNIGYLKPNAYNTLIKMISMLNEKSQNREFPFSFLIGDIKDIITSFELDINNNVVLKKSVLKAIKKRRYSYIKPQNELININNSITSFNSNNLLILEVRE